MDSSTSILPSKLAPFDAPPVSTIDAWGLPRGHHGVEPATIQASQRARMLYAAVVAVAERGYSETTVADICRIAHVSRKTFYEQFSSREACFLAAYEAGHRSFVRTILESQHACGDWESRLNASIRACLLFFRDNPELARALLIEVRAAGDRAWAILDEAHDRLARMQQALYRIRQTEVPDLPDLPSEVFAAMIAAIERLITYYVRSNRTVDLLDIEPSFHFLLRSLSSGDPNATAALSRPRPLKKLDDAVALNGARATRAA